MAAVEVRKQTPATKADANGRETVPVVPISVDEPGMTRERRTALIARRRTHVVQWRAGLKQLPHFDPTFPYDIVHEYDLDWTTDPDYGHDAVKYLEINEDGTVTAEKPKNKVLHVTMLQTLLAMLGRRAVMEPRLHFGPELGAAASLFTSLGEPGIRVEPDLAVLAPGTVLSDRQIWDTTYDIHIDVGDPVPVLVCEILSDSTATRDLDGKRRLYETLGITEYVLCDVLGSLLHRGEPHSPPGMIVYRLEDGMYRESHVAGPDPSVFRSNVLGTSVRLLPPRDPARTREDFRFQWWDGEQGRWRDHRTDAEYEQECRVREREARGEARGETKMAIAALYRFLSELPQPSLDQIAAHWREHGIPDNVMDHILAVRETPSTWCALLLPDADPDPDADRPV